MENRPRAILLYGSMMPPLGIVIMLIVTSDASLLAPFLTATSLAFAVFTLIEKSDTEAERAEQQAARDGEEVRLLRRMVEQHDRLLELAERKDGDVGAGT